MPFVCKFVACHHISLAGYNHRGMKALILALCKIWGGTRVRFESQMFPTVCHSSRLETDLRSLKPGEISSI